MEKIKKIWENKKVRQSYAVFVFLYWFLDFHKYGSWVTSDATYWKPSSYIIIPLMLLPFIYPAIKLFFQLFNFLSVLFFFCYVYFFAMVQDSNFWNPQWSDVTMFWGLCKAEPIVLVRAIFLAFIVAYINNKIIPRVGGKDMKVLLAPNLQIAQTVTNPAATVEAEYGSNVVHGEKYTLAHHAVEGICPCLYANNMFPEMQTGDIILISHIDMDTLGGVLALQMRKPDVCEGFWDLVAYADVSGPHKVEERFAQAKTKKEKEAFLCLFACWQWLGHYRERYIELTDVTGFINKFFLFLTSLPENKKALEAGLKWLEAKNAEIEKNLIEEIEENGKFIRVFVSTSGIFCNANYYSPNKKKSANFIVTLNEKTGAITLSVPDKSYNCAEIMKKLFGQEAGGHPGIAGTPRGVKYTKMDLFKVVNYILQEV